MFQFIFQSFIFVCSVHSVYCVFSHCHGMWIFRSKWNFICIWYVRKHISHFSTNQFKWINPFESFSHWARNILESVLRHVHSKNMNQLVIWWAWQNSNDRRSTVCYFWIYSINHLNEKCFFECDDDIPCHSIEWWVKYVVWHDFCWK